MPFTTKRRTRWGPKPAPAQCRGVKLWASMLNTPTCCSLCSNSGNRHKLDVMTGTGDNACNSCCQSTKKPQLVVMAAAITTSCGFLVLWQQELQALSPVPVITSSLCLLPELLHREQHVGVLSIDAHSLTPLHWAGAGLGPHLVRRLVVKGMPPDGHFCQSILGNQAHLDADQAQQEVVAAALSLVQESPQLKTLVLECTNLPPYQSAIEMATGLKVLSLRDNPVLDKAANE